MLEGLFGTRSKIRILRYLINRGKYGATLEDISRGTKLSNGTIHPALKELEDTFIITSRPVGRSRLYTFNERHILANDVKNIINRESTAFVNIAKDFAKKIQKKNLKNIILFGSVARGDTLTPRDIDILLITKRGFNEDIASDLTLEIHDVVSVNIQTISLTEREVRSRIKRGDMFILEVLDQGKILYGEKRWLET